MTASYQLQLLAQNVFPGEIMYAKGSFKIIDNFTTVKHMLGEGLWPLCVLLIGSNRLLLISLFSMAGIALSPC